MLAADFPIGAAIALPQTLGERARLLTKHFSQVTPGNALKWDATEPTEGAFRYTDADALVAFAKANNLRVRGHTFVWHNQTPAWVFNDANGQPMTATAANKTLLLTRLENHIRAVGTRYANDIYAWDVVNEVIDENQGDGLRRSTWFNIAGLDYIRTAFRVARQVAPNAKLYINDYNTNVPAKRDKLFTLVQQLRAEGVPIDGVGHQMHSNVDWPTGADTDAMIAKFIPLGVAAGDHRDGRLHLHQQRGDVPDPAGRPADPAGRPVQGTVRRVPQVPGQPRVGDPVGPRRRRHLAGHVPGQPQGRAAALRRVPAGQAGVLVHGGHGVVDPRHDHDDHDHHTSRPPTTTTTTTTTTTDHVHVRPPRPPRRHARRPRRPRRRRSARARRRSGWSARRGRVVSRGRSPCRPARPG